MVAYFIQELCMEDTIQANFAFGIKARPSEMTSFQQMDNRMKHAENRNSVSMKIYNSKWLILCLEFLLKVTEYL